MNIDAALPYKSLRPAQRERLEAARENLAAGALPAAETLARGLQPGAGDGGG